MLRYDKIVKIKSKKHQSDVPRKTPSRKIFQLDSPEANMNDKPSNNEQKNDMPRETTSCKRFLSVSPENKSIEKSSHNVEQTKQVPKRNKSQNITSFLRPSQLSLASKPPTNQDSDENPKN